MNAALPSEPPLGGPSTNPLTLLIKVLVNGHNREPLRITLAGADCTVQEVKQLIQTLMPEHPVLARQRVMYQGRELRDNNAPLRSILRLEVRIVIDWNSLG